MWRNSMKVAVFGVGGMGQNVIGHLRKCELVSEIVAYDVQPDATKKAESNFHITTATDIGQVLRDTDIRLVFVTASNDAHKDLVLKSIKARKAIMCEKPIATSLPAAEEMVLAAEAAGVFFQIGFELRYSKLYTKVKEWIDAGLLGEVINVSCTYICSEFFGKGSWRNKLSTGGSMFGEKLSHYVDLPRWWINSEVKDVFSACAPNVIPYYEIHDNYHTICRYKNGVVSQLTFMMAPAVTFDGDPLQDVVYQQKDDGHALTFMIQGTNGAAFTDVFNRRIKRWEFGDSRNCFTSSWEEDLTWPQTEDHYYFHNTLDQTQNIVRRVAEGSPPKTPARDAYQTMKVCFAAEQSAKTGQIVRL